MSYNVAALLNRLYRLSALGNVLLGCALLLLSLRPRGPLYWSQAHWVYFPLLVEAALLRSLAVIGFLMGLPVVLSAKPHKAVRVLAIVVLVPLGFTAAVGGFLVFASEEPTSFRVHRVADPPQALDRSSRFLPELRFWIGPVPGDTIGLISCGPASRNPPYFGHAYHVIAEVVREPGCLAVIQTGKDPWSSCDRSLSGLLRRLGVPDLPDGSSPGRSCISDRRQSSDEVTNFSKALFGSQIAPRGTWMGHDE